MGCICVFAPPQMFAWTPSAASPALSAEMCFASPAAAPCGPGGRCTTAKMYGNGYKCGNQSNVFFFFNLKH